MDAFLTLAGQNLLTPMILSFALGLAAALARSDLSVPEAAAKTMALYLLFAIGFKGGVAVSDHGLTHAIPDPDPSRQTRRDPDRSSDGRPPSPWSSVTSASSTSPTPRSSGPAGSNPRRPERPVRSLRSSEFPISSSRWPYRKALPSGQDIRLSSVISIVSPAARSNSQARMPR